jgi:hypothetical protein
MYIIYNIYNHQHNRNSWIFHGKNLAKEKINFLIFFFIFIIYLILYNDSLVVEIKKVRGRLNNRIMQ